MGGGGGGGWVFGRPCRDPSEGAALVGRDDLEVDCRELECEDVDGEGEGERVRDDDAWGTECGCVKEGDRDDEYG